MHRMVRNGKFRGETLPSNKFNTLFLWIYYYFLFCIRLPRQISVVTCFVKIQSFGSDWRDLSTAQVWRLSMEAVCNRIDKIQRNTWYLEWAWLQLLPAKNILSFTPGFLSEFTSIDISMFGRIWRQGNVGLKSGFSFPEMNILPVYLLFIYNFVFI